MADELKEETTKEEDSNLGLILNPDSFIQHIKNLLNTIDFEVDSLSQLVEENYELMGYLNQFKKTFDFKIGNLLTLSLDLEREILGSPANDWYDNLLEMNFYRLQTNNKINRFVDSLLTQYFSILDIFIKSLTRIKKTKKDVDSLGSLYFYQDQKELSAEESKTFEYFLKNRESFEEIKAYRDYTVHHGNVNIESTKEGIIENQYPLNSYYVYVVKKSKGKTYHKSKRNQIKINILFRYHIAVLLENISNSLRQIREEFEREEFEEREDMLDEK